jgi:DNA-binding GntR family transcriptional regulator
VTTFLVSLGIFIVAVVLTELRDRQLRKRIVKALAHGEPLTGRRLVMEYGLPRGTVYVALDRLVEEGMIERLNEKHPHVFKLTLKGVIWAQTGVKKDV